MMTAVKLPSGWFMKDVEKAAARSAQWSSPPLPKSATPRSQEPKKEKK
jgi:hypothetical protein